MKDVVRIGAGSAFSNDSALTAPQMLAADPPDYLVFEHLSEGLMSGLADAMARSMSGIRWLRIASAHRSPGAKKSAMPRTIWTALGTWAT